MSQAAAVPAFLLLGASPIREEAPGDTTSVAAFRIDRHEVTNRQFAAFVRATGHVTQAERDGAAPVFVMPRRPVSLDDPRLMAHDLRRLGAGRHDRQ